MHTKPIEKYTTPSTLKVRYFEKNFSLWNLIIAFLTFFFHTLENFTYLTMTLRWLETRQSLGIAQFHLQVAGRNGCTSKRKKSSICRMLSNIIPHWHTCFTLWLSTSAFNLQLASFLSNCYKARIKLAVQIKETNRQMFPHLHGDKCDSQCYSPITSQRWTYWSLPADIPPQFGAGLSRPGGFHWKWPVDQSTEGHTAQEILGFYSNWCDPGLLPNKRTIRNFCIWHQISFKDLVFKFCWSNKMYLVHLWKMRLIFYLRNIRFRV